MKIGILAQSKERNITGINRVTVGTLNELLKIDKNNNYEFIGNTEWLNMDIPYMDILAKSNSTIPLSYTVMCNKYDIVHSHYRAFSINEDVSSCGRILTIHDIRPLVHPEWDTKSKYDYFNEAIRETAVKSDKIIAMSEYTKKEVIERYGIDDKKIKVIYSGLFSSPKDKYEEFESVKGKDYILSVSALDKNKNQEGLIDAFALFKNKNKDNDVKLVLTGPNRNIELLMSHLQKYPEIKNDVIFTGFVSDGQLKYLYKNALAFVYVSFYEGFGLPILEAMSQGKAVICSNVTSMPEVGGDAVEYCNPYDIESITCAMENVIFDNDRRKTLEMKAIVQSGKFSYKKSAQQTLEIYKTFE